MSEEKLSERLSYLIEHAEYLTESDVADAMTLEAEVKTLKEQIKEQNEVIILALEDKARLSQAQELIEKWRTHPEMVWKMSGLNGCADELEKALGG
jgi:GTPase involved in cell partitioning and DNA repair